MTTRRSTAYLIDRMIDVAIEATSPKARSFAEAMCRLSRRPGWRPTPAQRRYMGFCVDDLNNREVEAFELFEPYDA